MNEIVLGHLAETPLGEVWVGVREGRLVGVMIGRSQHHFLNMLSNWLTEYTVVENPTVTDPFITQIAQYLAGDRRSFELPIDWAVLKPFQRNALRLVNTIPYGETRSYGDIARTLGNPAASRAVGSANAQNPMPIVIPCHRVVGSDGKLTGYSGANGLKSKAWLLHLEGALQARQMSLF
jgi:methylated-DNA-[protein]-cysteine S-methyltransferase